MPHCNRCIWALRPVETLQRGYLKHGQELVEGLNKLREMYQITKHFSVSYAPDIVDTKMKMIFLTSDPPGSSMGPDIF